MAGVVTGQTSKPGLISVLFGAGSKSGECARFVPSFTSTSGFTACVSELEDAETEREGAGLSAT